MPFCLSCLLDTQAYGLGNLSLLTVDTRKKEFVLNVVIENDRKSAYCPMPQIKFTYHLKICIKY